MVLVLFAAGRIWDSVSGDDARSYLGQVTQEELDQARSIAIAQSTTALSNNAPKGSGNWSVEQAQENLLESWEDYLYEGSVSSEDQAEFEKIYLALERVRPQGPFEASALFISRSWNNNIVDGALHFDPVLMWQGVVLIVWELPQIIWNAGFHWFISLFGFLFVYVLCIGGGAISRMQVVQHSRSQRMSVSTAIDFAVDRWRALLEAVFGPAMVVAFLSVVLMLMGLALMNVPWLNLVGGLLYGISLLMGLIVALVAVGYCACFPILIPAVVIENCGGGEAVQRSFAYLTSKTIRFVGYLAMLIIAMVLGYIVVRLIANLTLDITANLVGAGTYNQSLVGAGSIPESSIPAVGARWYEVCANWFVTLWETVVHDLMIGWVFSGFFSVSAMMYLLMRSSCDAQDTRDIWWQGVEQGTNIPRD
tara:strand:- start:936 stop:2198 length:1263 start_codon:yes stop_codon:yes gene_type:complete